MTGGKGSGRNPPEEHQFQKGLSGNPHGRPRKRRRAHIPSQVAKDVLAVAGTIITMKNGQGIEEKSTIMQAYFRALANYALRGKPSAMKLFGQLLTGALYDNVRLNPEFEQIDKLEREMAKRGIEPNESMRHLVEYLATCSTKPS